MRLVLGFTQIGAFKRSKRSKIPTKLTIMKDWDLYGISIAVTIRSLDRSLFIRLIVQPNLRLLRRMASNIILIWLMSKGSARGTLRNRVLKKKLGFAHIFLT